LVTRLTATCQSPVGTTFWSKDGKMDNQLGED